ncbi:MAG: hypothetical protein KDA84_09075 [Planctomycetaceae bacterium]|nr:hypothetical protein [Planctomycetaceae bacterium]
MKALVTAGHRIACDGPRLPFLRKAKPMIESDKKWLRLALAIHERLQRTHHAPKHVELPATWPQYEVLCRRLRRANSRGWFLAAARLRRELREMLRRLQAELLAIQHLLEADPNSFLASARDIHADLLALDQDFDEVRYNHREQTLSVTTEAIELESIYLGPFEIRLDLAPPRCSEPFAYRVIAKDPNSAAANESVTHPHIQDELLCEGDGREPIRNALEQGRLHDFYVVVANLLRTYNPDSPYVSLNDWYGVACADCGISVPDEDGLTCSSCEALVCDACYCGCSACGGSYCG